MRFSARNLIVVLVLFIVFLTITGVFFVVEFWRGGTRSRIVFLEGFARGPLITAHDSNTEAFSLLR